MTPLVVLDRQHAGKPGSADQGARFADGTTEAQHAMRYIDAAAPILRRAGIAVAVITTGTYPDRNRTAGAAELYVACHVNAGGGTYALTEYSIDTGPVDASAAAALALLEHADDELGQAAVGPWPLKTGQRGHVCIAHCAGPAVIYEPYFVEHPRLDAPDVGRALAAGVIAYLHLDHQEPPMPADPTDVVDAIAAPAGGVWAITADGGVHARDGAPYYGSFPEDVAAGRATASADRHFVAIAAYGAGYELVTNALERYRYPPR